MPVEKLTPEVHEILLGSIRRGAYLSTACDHAGISTPTLDEWRKRGAADTEAGGRRANTIYAKLHRDLQRAVAEVEELCTGAILHIGRTQKQWTAFAWWLERRYPHRWGRASIEADGANGLGPLAMRPEDQAVLVERTEQTLVQIREAERLALPAARDVVILE